MTEAVQRLSAVLADRYVIERELGAGGMATVYLAHEAARAVLPTRNGILEFLTASLRDAARYAALAGDTATALRAARRYLRLRTDPDSETIAERDSVRALLVRLERR